MNSNWSDLSRELQVFFICAGLAMGCLLVSLFVDKWAYALDWFGSGLMVGGWWLVVGGFINLWRQRF